MNNTGNKKLIANSNFVITTIIPDLSGPSDLSSVFSAFLDVYKANPSAKVSDTEIASIPDRIAFLTLFLPVVL